MMVDFRLVLNTTIRQNCELKHRKFTSTPFFNHPKIRKNPEMSKLKKKYVLILAIAVVIIILIGLVTTLIYNAKSKNEPKLPPNPTKPLPASASTLHKFKKAAVCADGAVCAEIGKQILQDKNGSAVDAALATMFCNGMVTMQSMGLGGGFLMTIYIRENSTAYSLNAREKAPFKASNKLYKDDPLKSKHGPLSVAVPGELKGYWAAHQRFGKLSWKEIIQPSIELCQNGYVMTKHQYESLFKNKLFNDTNFRSWFYDPAGQFRKPGSTIIPHQLCQTLKTISEKGANDLYNGSLADKLVEDLQKIGSVITKQDLANYTTQWMEPVSANFQDGTTLFSFPPPGSGLLLAFIMNILDGFNFTRNNIDGTENTVKTYHKIVEAFKYAYAKRTELGDTNFVNISQLMKNLTSNLYASEIRQKIGKKTSQNPQDYGAVFYSPEDHGTAHISVLAENGDAVSVTSSVNIYFGAGFTSEQTGIIMNSVMDDFSFPFFKNYFGLPGSPNNALVPGKRPLSSMSPSILTDGKGDVKLVIGASGGTKITTSIALVIMRILWFGENIKEALDAPRIHHQLYPMEVEYEYGTLQQYVDGLEKLGHKTKRYEGGGSIICALLRELDEILANADYRKGGDVYGI